MNGNLVNITFCYDNNKCQYRTAINLVTGHVGVQKHLMIIITPQPVITVAMKMKLLNSIFGQSPAKMRIAP